MHKLDFLKILSERKSIKISKPRYTSCTFRLDENGNVTSFSKAINLSNNFEIRNDMDIDRLLNHLLEMQKENFKITIIK